MKRLSLLAAFGLAALVTSPAAAQTMIDTGANTVSTAPPFGAGRGAQDFAGQTFTVPTLDYFLNSFSFTACCSVGQVSPVAWIYAWSGGGLSGPALFTGAFSSMSAASVNPGGSFDYLWNVGSLALTPGAQYAAFLTSYDDGVEATTDRDALYAVSDNYVGGTAIAGNGGTATSLPTSWNSQTYDVMFRATFTGPAVGVPEPSTYLLMLSGVLGLGFVAWRRKEDLAA